MIAKLFDQINLRSLLAACFSILIFALPFIIWLNRPAALEWYEQSWLYFLPALFTAIFFGEITNRQRSFEGHYHIPVLFTAFLLCFLPLFTELSALLTFPFLLIFFLRASGLLTRQEIRFLVFDLGLMIGFGSLFFLFLLLLAPLSIILLIAVGRFQLRLLVILFLGIAAALYTAIAGLAIFGLNLWPGFIEALTQWSFHPNFNLAQPWFSQLIPLSLVPLVVLLYPSIAKRSNNLQRQNLIFWLVILIVSVAGGLFLDKLFWWALILPYPLSILLGLSIKQSSNRWFRNGFYLMLLGGVLLSLVFFL